MEPFPPDPPATLRQRLDFALRTGLLMVSGIPSITLIPMALTQSLTRRFRREEFMTRVHLMVPWSRFCLERILGARLDIHGREHLPRPSRGHMYVSNHQSYADILLLIVALDTVAFLSKREVHSIPIIGWAAYAGGSVFVRRSSPEDRARALEETIRMCRESTAVVVFPEGTVSEDGNLRGKVYLRALERAHEAGLSLVPLGLHGTLRMMPNTLDRYRPGTPLSVRIGPPLRPQDYPSGPAMAQACWERVRALHQEAAESYQRLSHPGPCGS